MVGLCSKDPSSSLIRGKRLGRFLSGTSDHGLAHKPTSSFDGSLTVMMYGDASLMLRWILVLDTLVWLDKSMV